jgi:hypothetical protein
VIGRSTRRERGHWGLERDSGVQGSEEWRDKINGNAGWVDRAGLREGERDVGFIVVQGAVRDAIPGPG